MKNFDKSELRHKLMGLGESSQRKSYYAELLEKTEALELNNLELKNEITKRKDAEIELIKLNEALEVRIEDRTQSLRILNDQLIVSMKNLQFAMEALNFEEKNKALLALMVGLSHEINTPLGNSITAVTFQGKLLDDLKETIGRQENNEKLLELINELSETNTLILRNLDINQGFISNIQTIFEDHVSNNAKSFDAVAYVKTILLTLKHSLDRSHVKVDLSLQESPMIVFGYPSVLSRVLNHLIEDSLIHAFEKIAEPHIIITLSRDNNYLIMQYHDNGIGIHKELLSQVFDPFFTMARTQKKVGLGLYGIRYMIEDQLGGQVTLWSGEGQGVMFTIKIPISS